MRKRPRLFYGWVVLACAMGIIAISSGTRFSFGVILKPLTEQFGWDRTSVAFMASISVLVSGLLQPGLGWLVDWRGLGYVVLLVLHALPHPAMLYTAVLVLGMSWSSKVSSSGRPPSHSPFSCDVAQRHVRRRAGGVIVGSVPGLDIRAQIWCINIAADGSSRLFSPWFTTR